MGKGRRGYVNSFIDGFFTDLIGLIKNEVAELPDRLLKC